MASDIDLEKMKHALSEYGSLEKVVDRLRAEKLTLESEKVALLTDRARLRREVSSLETRKARLSAEVQDVGAKLEKRRWQHQLFVAFMALVTAQDPQDITQFAASVREWETVSITDPAAARGRIIKQLMGSVVKLFRCSSCGTQCLMDRAPQWPRGKHHCPVCSGWLDPESDDSLVNAFLSHEQAQEMKEVVKLRAEVERLKPGEPFLDIPCAVCGKPMPNNWKRESTEKFFKANGLAHPNCLNTSAGQLLLLEMAVKQLAGR